MLRIGEKPDQDIAIIRSFRSMVEKSKCVQVADDGSMLARPGTETFKMTIRSMTFLLEIGRWAYDNRVLFQRDHLGRSIDLLRYTIKDIEDAEQRSNSQSGEKDDESHNTQRTG